MSYFNYFFGKQICDENKLFTNINIPFLLPKFVRVLLNKNVIKKYSRPGQNFCKSELT